MEHVRGEERPVSAGKEADEYQRTFYIWSTGDRRTIRSRLRANGVQLQKVARGFAALQSGRLCFAQTCCCACLLLLLLFFSLKISTQM